MSTLTAAKEGPIDRPGHVETRGIDLIESSERHGRPIELFAVWFASNLSYLYVVLGGALILTGLTLIQAIVIIFVGNLFYFFVGAIATSGPTYGTSTVNISRLMFGTQANKFAAALPTWFLAVAFEAINLSFGALAGFALLEDVGVRTTTPVEIAVLALVGAATFSLSILGHATIVRAHSLVAGLMAFAAVILFGFTLGHANFGYHPAHPLTGIAGFGAFFIGLTLIASGPLTWVTFPAEFARYLPRSTPPRSVAMWTALGGYLSSTFLGVVGVLAGTVVNMANPQVSMKTIMPAWFYPLFLALIIVGTTLNNVLGTYSSGLALQTMGVRARRSRTVLVDCVVAGAMTTYALFGSNFLTTLTNFLALSEIILAPFAGIFITHMLLTRRPQGRHVSAEAAHLELESTPPTLASGVLGMLLGGGAAFLCADTIYWHGPISTALGGADLAPYVGVVLGAITYAVSYRLSYRKRDVPNLAVPLTVAEPAGELG